VLHKEKEALVEQLAERKAHFEAELKSTIKHAQVNYKPYFL
jgi:hypothetical protein